jgi:ferrous iron transport protein A
VTTLAEFQVGQRSQVAGVDGSDEISVRLLEMGLTPGVSVTMMGVAPWGDPIEIEVRGYRLSLRRSEAARVRMVSKLETA